MAWDDIVGSVMRAAKILGKEVAEQDMPQNWGELRRLHEDLWRQVKVKRRSVGKW